MGSQFPRKNVLLLTLDYVKNTNSIVESLAIFGDDNINWRPNHYNIQGN